MIDTLIQETEKLTALIEDETDRLLRTRPSDLSEVIKLKDQQAQRYEALIAGFKPAAPALTSAAQDMRAQLRQAILALDAALLRNGDVLLRLQKNSLDLLETIATALNPNSQRPQVYGATGQALPSRASGALALNTRI